MQFQHLPQDGCPRPGRVVPRDQQPLQRRPQAAGIRLQARERKGLRLGETMQVKSQSRNLSERFDCIVHLQGLRSYVSNGHITWGQDLLAGRILEFQRGKSQQQVH